jgi:hypothetical protein
MHWIAYVLGSLAVVAGAIATEAVRTGRLADGALETLTLDRTPLSEAARRWFVLGLGAVLFSGGGALLLLSRWAAPIFILGTLLASGYVLYAGRVLPPSNHEEALGRRHTITATYVYAAATAVVLWLESQGVLN